MDIVKNIEDTQKREVAEFNTGDTVQVFYRIVEGSREGVQVFEGTVVRRQGTGVRETFAIRKISYGVGAKRIFLVRSPRIEQTRVVRRGRVRRAKLYYSRERQSKAAKTRKRKTL